MKVSCKNTTKTSIVEVLRNDDSYPLNVTQLKKNVTQLTFGERLIKIDIAKPIKHSLIYFIVLFDILIRYL